jgi:hypothetical protein
MSVWQSKNLNRVFIIREPLAKYIDKLCFSGYQTKGRVIMRPSALKPGMFLKFVLNGFLITLPQEIYTQIMKYFHLTNISAYEAGSMLYMREPSWVLGALALPCIDILGAIVFFYLLEIIGRDDLILKSIFYSMVVNSILFQIFGTITGNTNVMQDTSGNFVFASSSALAGFSGGIFLQKFILK